VRNGHDQVGDCDRDRNRNAVAHDVAEGSLEEIGNGGLAEEANSERSHRDAELARR
jgi:hypothetical protein